MRPCSAASRPFDGGDDGLVYDGWSRIMAQQLLAGDIVGALQGIEPVFYFTPGSRYLRTVEHLFFGETYFGYVSLLLLLPFLVFCLFRRYFTARTAMAITLIFIAIPVGALFGSTFYLYVKHAAHGYGDSAAAVLFLAGIIALIGRSRRGPGDSVCPAFGAALLFAVAVCVRPNLAIGAAVLLGGAGTRGAVAAPGLAARRHVHRLSAGVQHGAAQLVLRRCVRPVQQPHRHRRGDADAAACVCRRRYWKCCGSILPAAILPAARCRSAAC